MFHSFFYKIKFAHSCITHMRHISLHFNAIAITKLYMYISGSLGHLLRYTVRCGFWRILINGYRCLLISSTPIKIFTTWCPKGGHPLRTSGGACVWVCVEGQNEIVPSCILLIPDGYCFLLKRNSHDCCLLSVLFH